MTKLHAAQVALAFNSATDRKSWTARANSRPQTGMDFVHFGTRTGLISIVYNTIDGRFHVRFNKFQAAWGDYISAIANSLYYVLTTLKQAGLPFEAPDSPEGIIIEATNTADAYTYVRWPEPPEEIDPVMPEQRGGTWQPDTLPAGMLMTREEAVDAILEDWPDAPEPAEEYPEEPEPEEVDGEYGEEAAPEE